MSADVFTERSSPQPDGAGRQTVLVTGGGGFLGQYLVEQLVADGHRVRNLSRGTYPQLEALGVESITADLRDPAATRRACRGVQVVFHVAALAGIGGRWQAYYEINVRGTEHLIAACRAEGVAKLIYTSSPSVTFNGSPQCGVDERAGYAQRWLCHYPRSKALAEQKVLAAHESQGLLTCALRPHLIWGPRDQHLVPRLLERAKRGQLRRVGRGENLVDMIYVENAAAAHRLAERALRADSPAGGRAYFLSQGEPVNLWDWIDQILALIGLPPVRRGVNARVAWHAGAVLEWVFSLLGRTDEPRMTRFLAAQLSQSHYFDISAARRDLGYVPQISTQQGMLRLGRWLNQGVVP